MRTYSKREVKASNKRKRDRRDREGQVYAAHTITNLARFCSMCGDPQGSTQVCVGKREADRVRYVRSQRRAGG
jgi:hypothetical protein